MRCRSCDVPLTGHVRYKSGEEFDGKFIEEDMCTQCILIVDTIDYVSVKSYQFEDITDSFAQIMRLVKSN